MTLKEVMDKCSGLGVDEMRCMTDEYIELVVYNVDIDAWHSIMTEVMGPAVSPAGIPPTAEDLEVTKDYGGLWTDQVLYKKVLRGMIMIAMFWPWQNHRYTTIRMARIESDAHQ